MFNQIGGKIKGLATFSCLLGIFLSIILGVILGLETPLVGFLIAIFGTVLSWLSSFILYGFGELVDCVMQINDVLRRMGSITPQKEQ